MSVIEKKTICGFSTVEEFILFRKYNKSNFKDDQRSQGCLSKNPNIEFVRCKKAFENY